MLRSMTAFGRAKTVKKGQGSLTVEVQSVNRKYLEVTTYLPVQLSGFDIAIKKHVNGKIDRGQVNVRVSFDFPWGILQKATPNLTLAKQLFEAWNSIAKEVGAAVTPVEAIALFKDHEGLIALTEEAVDDNNVLDMLLATLDEALAELSRMKAAEGKELHQDIVVRLDQIKKWLVAIEERSKGAIEKYRVKLVERLNEYFSNSVENEERVLREICLYVDKIDITEELIRFQSHIKQFESYMVSAETSLGKRLEFLTQEMSREINTISSKTAEVDVLHLAVEIKGTLEKIREQLQNIE